MSRKKDNFVPFSEWQTLTAGKEKRFIRLGASLLRCEQFASLSSSAKVLYIYMLLNAGGQKKFEMPHSEYKSIMAKNTFLQARNELISSGFVTIAENNANLRKPNLFEFSSEWKKIKPP